MTTATVPAGSPTSTAVPPAAAPSGQGTPPAPAATPQATASDTPKVSTSTAPASTPAPAAPSLLDPASVLPPKADAKQGDSKPATDAKQTDQPKPGDKPASTDAPAVIELKLPADAKIDASAIDSVKALATTHKFAPEAAQAVLEHGNALVKGYEDGVRARWAETTKTWIEDVKKDAEVGGEKLATSLENVARVTARFFAPEFIQELKTSGMANHPGLFKSLAKIGAAMRDDRIDAPSGGGGGNGGGDSLAAAIKNELSAVKTA